MSDDKRITDLGRIGVLMGGCSSERDISLKSGKAIVANLTTVGCEVLGLGFNTTDPVEITELLKDNDIDLVFIALHGAFGEDGKIQAIIDGVGIPYTGSDERASRLAMDKTATQELMQENNVKVPPFMIIKSGESISADDILSQIQELPVVVKPACEGSSIGISIVNEKASLEEAIQKAFSFGGDVLVEKFIIGRELTVGVLDGETLPIVEIRPKDGFFDFDAKYQKGKTKYIVPAPIDTAAAEAVKLEALRVYHLLGCRDMARMDYIFDANNQAFFLEANTIPGFTETSLLPMAAKKVGYGFPQLCLKIAQAAWQRKKVNLGTG
ncbi:MAG: D-alanine--D-alanine ligase [Candidatus Omnitrophica bacterium]|nr:D-alanine--D-alanine ligase [Candidatus Omnitrophota bacterium]